MVEGSVQSGPGSAAGVTWRKSTYSAYNGNCVEMADLGQGRIGVRDSKAGEAGPVLSLTPDRWQFLLRGIKAGRYGLPRG